jgi:hypothetical protein
MRRVNQQRKDGVKAVVLGPSWLSWVSVGEVAKRRYLGW